MSKKISASAYAKHRGISLVSVSKAIQSGKISAEQNGKGYLIDPVVADREWSGAVTREHGKASLQPSPVSGQEMTYAKSRAIKEAYAARLKKLEYEQAMGSMVDSDEVRRQAYAAGKLTQTKIMSIPIRIAPQLAGMDDVQEIRRLLEDELRYALEELTRGK